MTEVVHLVRIEPSVLAAQLSDERAPDIVEALNAEAPEVAAAILLGLSFERAVEVLDQPELACAADIIEILPRDRVATYLFGPGIWWSGFALKRLGSADHALQIAS